MTMTYPFRRNLMQFKYLSIAVALSLPSVCLPAWAQYQNAGSSGIAIESELGQPSNAVRPPFRSVELTVGGQKLTNGFGDWRDVTLRGAYEVGDHVLQLELASKRQFGESGVFLGLADTYTFNQDWYGSLSVGAGDGAFYLPTYRVDGSLYRKFLEKRNLVASLGAGYYKAPAGNVDRNINVGATYYFDGPWIVEGGVRFNNSRPGSIDTRQQFASVTYGRVRQYLITARYGQGGEGYQTVAQNTQLVNFKSKEASLSWRYWLDSQSGFLISGEHYRNPNYSRRGANIGFFHQY